MSLLSLALLFARASVRPSVLRIAGTNKTGERVPEWNIRMSSNTFPPVLFSLDHYAYTCKPKSTGIRTERERVGEKYEI